MKEFDKWMLNDHTKEDAWRAALEWAYKQETDPEPTKIGDAILRELGGK